jgi:hypothetical protein
MAHYFDDIFTRHVGPPRLAKPAHIRRSSTTRSIGARSDYDISTNGDLEDDVRSLGNSVGPDHLQREHERQEANAHIATYVTEQLEKVRSNDSLAFDNNEDEYEAQLDGQ